MSCKPFKTSEANAKSYLKTMGAINKYLTIIDENLFNKHHKILIEQTDRKYIPGFKSPLFVREEYNRDKIIPNKIIFKKIDKINGVNYQKQSFINDKLKESENSIRDLAARLSARIGSKGTFSSDLTKDYAGWSMDNQWEINLAKATLDTVFHEIAFHPIISALKRKSNITFEQEIDNMVNSGLIEKNCN